MREFEMGLAELTEAYIDADIEFNTYMEGLAIDEEGYYYSESTMMYLTEADLKEMGSGAKQAVGNMVQSFFDFLNGAFQNLCNKLMQKPNLKGLASSLKTKAEQARKTVSQYWNQLKDVKGTDHGDGRLNSIKTKISNIIAKFKRMCEDAKKKIGAAAGKAADAAKGVKNVPGKVKASAKATAMKGAENRAAAAEAKGKDPISTYQRMNRYQ